MERVIKYRVIMGDRFLDEMMHATDVFESFKHMGEAFNFTVTYTKKESFTKHIEKLKEGLEEKYVVSFIGVLSVNDNPPKKCYYYVNPSTKVISWGTRWAMFGDILLKMGYKVTTNNEQCIVNVDYNRLNYIPIK